MNGKVMIRFLLPLLLLNAGYAWLAHPEFPLESELGESTWAMPVLPERSRTAVEKVLASGFWGEVEKTEPVAESTGVQTIAQAEKWVQRAVKGIVQEPGNPQVVVQLGKNVSRLKPGETLPDSDWTLESIAADRLVLRDQAGERHEVRLFSRK